MKKLFLFCTVVFIATSISVAQNNVLTTGSNNHSIERIQLNNTTDLSLTVATVAEVELMGKTSGVSRGFKIVPMLPFLPKYAPGVVDVAARELEAEEKALEKSNGDILLNKKVERTYTGFAFVLWFEKVEVSGFAAKLKK